MAASSKRFLHMGVTYQLLQIKTPAILQSLLSLRMVHMFYFSPN